jgi:hypothetical protein
MFEMLETGRLLQKKLFLGEILTEVLKLDKDRLYVSVLKESRECSVRPRGIRYLETICF